MSCVFPCFRVCSLLPCGHQLQKGWPLGSCLWFLIVFLSLSHVVSWVRCGTWLYRFLIFATFLSFNVQPGTILFLYYLAFFISVNQPKSEIYTILCCCSYHIFILSKNENKNVVIVCQNWPETYEYSMTFYSVFVNLRKKCALDCCTITNLKEINHNSPIA